MRLDGLDATHDTDQADAISLLKRIDWSWSAAFATESLLEKLEFAGRHGLRPSIADTRPGQSVDRRERFDRRHLSRAHRRCAVRSDVGHLTDSLTTRRQFAAPMPGRWLNPPRTLLLRAVAEQYGRAGFTEDRTELLE